MNLLVVTTVDAEYTATFIKIQIAYFNVSHVLHTEYRPYKCNGVSILQFPINVKIFRKLIKNALPYIYKRLYDNQLERFLRQYHFDAVLCNFGTYGANIADACHKVDIPFVVHFHGYDAFAHKTLARFAVAYRTMFEKAAFIIAVSEDMRLQLIQLGAPANKVVLRPYGVNTKLFSDAHPATNSKVLLFVGRFTAKKDPVSLLKAFHYAHQSVPDAKLVMIGRGELSQLVLKTIKELHVQDSVEVLGWQKPEEVACRMQQARAYVQHSVFAPNGDSEGSPVAIIEAAGCGLPVISTRHAGIKESVIEGVTGYLVDEGNWQGMGEYMIKLLNDPELAGKMGQAGRRHILEYYDIEQQMDVIKKILEKAITC